MMGLTTMLVGSLALAPQGVPPVAACEDAARAAVSMVAEERLVGVWDLDIPDTELPPNSVVTLTVDKDSDGGYAGALKANFDQNTYRGVPSFDGQTGEMLCEFPGTPYGDLTFYSEITGDRMAGQIVSSNGDEPLEFSGERQ